MRRRRRRNADNPLLWLFGDDLRCRPCVSALRRSLPANFSLTVFTTAFCWLARAERCLFMAPRHRRQNPPLHRDPYVRSDTNHPSKR